MGQQRRWPPHSITSSAVERSLSGTLRPRVLAVLRLITNSNFVGCSTGNSAGLAPWKILSTKAGQSPESGGDIRAVGHKAAGRGELLIRK
jgi:hypothetical protein